MHYLSVTLVDLIRLFKKSAWAKKIIFYFKVGCLVGFFLCLFGGFLALVLCFGTEIMEEGADFLFKLPVSVQEARKEQFFTSWFRSSKSNCAVPNEEVGALLTAWTFPPRVSVFITVLCGSTALYLGLTVQKSPQHLSVCKNKGFVLINMKSSMGGRQLMFFCWLDPSQFLLLND